MLFTLQSKIEIQLPESFINRKLVVHYSIASNASNLKEEKSTKIPILSAGRFLLEKLFFKEKKNISLDSISFSSLSPGQNQCSGVP